jgi:hypothetical protein
MQIDELDARHRAQDLLGRFDHAARARMPVQRDAHLDPLAQERPQPVEVIAQEQREVRGSEGTSSITRERALSKVQAGRLKLEERTPAFAARG